MIFFVLVLLLIIFSSAKYEKHNEFNLDYITRDATNNIKGIFVILILFSHSAYYLSLNGEYDKPYIQMQGHLGQMVVAMFLFYSGYGIMEQIKKRGFSYIMSIPKKRFPNLLLNFDLAEILYVVLFLALGNKLSLKGLIKAFTAWEGIGNSSWYIFVTFCLYIFTFISFFAIKWFNKKCHHLIYLTAFSGLTVLLVVVLAKFKVGQSWWFNTAILFPLGMWYSYFKDTIEKVLMKNDMLYYSALAVAVALYLFTYIHRSDRFISYELWAIMFTLGLTLITMKVKIESNLLKWFGEHIFSIYILQRIPMIILKDIGVADSHKYIFVILSIAVTCAMAEIFDVLTGKLSKRIWKDKKTA